VISLTVVASLHAQDPRNPVGAEPPGGIPDGLDSTVFTAPDSLQGVSFLAFQYDDSLALTEVGIDVSDRQLDPARSGPHDYGSLGNLGSPLYPLAYQGVDALGMRTGITAFDLYMKRSDELRFYKTNQALADFLFAQTGTQNNIRFDALFARDLQDDLHFTIDYQRINHSGYYNQHRSKHSFLNTGLWYHSDDGRYHTTLVFTTNSINQESNGGITTKDLFDEDGFELRANIPVALDRAGIILQDRELTWHHEYTLLGHGKSDALVGDFSISYASQRSRYSDENIANDSSFYRVLWTDPRGLRSFYSYRSWNQELGLRTAIGKSNYRQELRAYVRAEQRLEDLETEVRTVNPIYIGATLDSRLSSAISLDAYAELLIGDDRGRYKLGAEITGTVGRALGLTAGASSIIYDPGWIYERQVASGIDIRNLDLANSQEDKLYGVLSLLQDRVKVGAHLYRLDNYTYFDSDYTTQVSRSAVLLQRLQLDWKLQWRRWHWDGSAFLQNYDEPLYGMPRRYARTSLYYNDLWFNDELDIQLGVQLRMADRYALPWWQPGLMSFYRNPVEDFVDYIPLDVFFQFRIDRFRVFINAENVTAALGGPIYYTVANHPMNELRIRFGFRWRLLN